MELFLGRVGGMMISRGEVGGAADLRHAQAHRLLSANRLNGANTWRLNVEESCQAILGRYK